MQFLLPDIWPRTKEEALAAQLESAGRIESLGNTGDIELIAAIDTAYGKNAETLYAAAVVLTFPDLQEVERSVFCGPVDFPYVPGLFFYREGKTILNTLGKLESEPDLIIVHGHGTAHPRKCGIASQVGLAVGKPSIGCARKLLVGNHRPVDTARGGFQPVLLKSKEVGCVYRSKENVKPIFISPGNRCDTELARDIVVRCLRGFRLPEPLRLAHLFANKFRRRQEKKKRPCGPKVV